MNTPYSLALFEDPMTASWEQNWFVDGENAVLEHTGDGLRFHTPSSGVSREDKNTYRDKFDAQHAVLWTRQEFEGDLRITYEWQPIHTDWANLIYLQAQGIGTGPYEKDIHTWRDLRRVSSMDLYFNTMTLLSLSLRGEIRCKRYPWNDIDRDLSYEDTLVEPMADHPGLPDGHTYQMLIEKRYTSCRLVITDTGSGSTIIDFTWDLSHPSPERKTPFFSKGRIGFRQMGGNDVIFRNLTVSRLS
jgi:hypothetical protein